MNHNDRAKEVAKGGGNYPITRGHEDCEVCNPFEGMDSAVESMEYWLEKTKRKYGYNEGGDK